MLDYKSFKGKPAYRRVKTFIGVPEEYAGHITKDFKCKKSTDLEYYKFMKVADICKHLGGKW